MEETKKISKELFFCYEKQIGAEKNKIMQVKSADGNIININWDLKEEDYTEDEEEEDDGYGEEDTEDVDIEVEEEEDDDGLF